MNNSIELKKKFFLGRSTSWRDEDPSVDNAASLQRSISTVATLSTDRTGNNKGSGIGAAEGVGSISHPRLSSSKISQLWTVNNAAGVDADENLPEWAIENPSKLGGSFDASGAFHGDTDLKPIKSSHNTLKTKSLDSYDDVKRPKSKDLSDPDSGNDITPETSLTKDTNTTAVQEEVESSLSPISSTTTKEVIHGDISDRIKEVADEVEKLIMDDDHKISSNQSQHQNHDGFTAALPRMADIEINVKPSVTAVHRQAPSTMPIQITPTITDVAPPSHPVVSFSDHETMQHHNMHHLPQFPMIPTPHIITPNLNELWFYRDPQANVQGPFSAVEMTEWYRAGYFNENLFVRRYSDNRFRPLGELIKFCHGNMPFTHSHLLPSPIELENIPVGQIPAPLTASLSITPHKPSPIPIALSVVEQQLQQQRDEQLKANVTATAEALRAAIKGSFGGNSIGNTSHLLTMRFQMLQDQYIQHQEYQILAELSKNECFQRLSAVEQETVVRRKVQLLGLPEYLISLNGLSNSLSVLNPVAGRQLYRAVVEHAKKDQQHIFANTEQQRSVGNLLDANNFILNAQIMIQQSQQEVGPLVSSVDCIMQGGTAADLNKPNEIPRNELDLINEYNLRMLLRGQPTSTQQQPPALTNSATENLPGVDFLTETQLLERQNLMIPIWLPPNNNKQQETDQQWAEMSNADASLWETANLNEERNEDQQLLIQKSSEACFADTEKDVKIAQLFQVQSGNVVNHTALEELDQSPQNLKGSHNQKIVKSLVSDIQQNHNEELNSHQHQVKQANKQNLNTKQNAAQSALKPINNENDRKREQTEEKKRQREERKRQQLEDDKRRALNESEEQTRQIQEEKERQQQIQAQRRKALLGNVHSLSVQNGMSG